MRHVFRRVGSHIWEWLNETPPNKAMQCGSANKINVNCDDGWKNDAGFVSRPDTFMRKVSTKCMTKKYGTPFIVVFPDGSLRRSADGLVDIHTNRPLSFEIKCLFHVHKGFQCILKFQSGISRSVRYMEQMVLQSEGHLLLCWSPKNGFSKMLRIITA